MSPVATCARVRLEAVVHSSLQTIEGALTCVVASGGTLHVARFPALLQDYSEVDELTAGRVYPQGFDGAELELETSVPRVSYGAADGNDLWQSFGPVQQHQRVTVRFRTRVPRRLGTFGSHQGIATLLGGWHPVVGTGPGPSPKLLHGLIQYRITVPRAVAGFVGTHPFARNAQRLRLGQHHGTAVPMVVAPGLHVHHHRGGLLVAPMPRHNSVYGNGDISACTDETAHDQALWTAAVGDGFLRQAWAQEGQNTSRTHPPPFIVITPLRDHLSEAFEWGVAISDRAFHLLPFETFRRFHRASLWREQFRAALTPHFCRTEPDWPGELLADATAAALTDRLLTATGAMAYAPQLLQKFSMSPAIDELIYAPQIPFPEVFYDAVDESRQASLRFDHMMTPLPRGKIIYEKLRDLIGRDQAFAFMLHNLQATGGSFAQRLRARVGNTRAEGILAWLGPYPAMDYALVGIASTPDNTQVRVEDVGPEAGRIIEPITVEVTDQKRVRHRQTRLGPGPLAFDVPGPARVVELDPEQRLVERHHPPRLQARFNNRDPKRYRVLLNDLSATLDVTGRAFTANFDLLGRRLYDLRQDMHLAASFGPYSYGAQAGYSGHFGRELTALRLAHTASINGAWSRLRSDRASGTPAGQLITLGLSYRYDTRLSRLMALRGTGFDSVATLGVTTLSGEHGVNPWLLLGASALKIIPTWGRQALLLRLRYDGILGQAPPQAQLRLGGRYLGARGYQLTEAYGPSRLLASAEYRQVLTGDSRTDVFGLATLTGVEGALFADGVYMPHLRPVSYGSILADVGYGVRIMGDVLGVSPATLAIDVAYPIGRRASGHSPITVYVAFVQSFLAF